MDEPMKDFRRGPAETIRFGSAESSLGWVVVAWSGVGICSIELGDSPELLEAGLRSRFPKAIPAETIEVDLRRVVGRVEAPGLAFDEPLDVRGSAFQLRVWDALRSIPAGATSTYAEVARAIGHPSAARAVARAVATNNLAVAIPCHRVVRGDGGLGGFRWGVDRKRALLAIEAVDPVPPGSPAA